MPGPNSLGAGGRCCVGHRMFQLGPNHLHLIFYVRGSDNYSYRQRYAIANTPARAVARIDSTSLPPNVPTIVSFLQHSTSNSAPMDRASLLILILSLQLLLPRHT